MNDAVKKCGACGGRGYWNKEQSRKGSVRELCPVCGGTGVAASSPARDTGMSEGRPSMGMTVVVSLDDAPAIASLVRMGCAAYAALPIPATAAVDQMRRERALQIGRAFLDTVDPHDEGDQ